MAKILGIIYMVVLFLFCIWYLVFQTSEWIDRMKAKKRMREAREQEPVKPQEPKPVVDVVGKSTTVFLAPLTPSSIEPFMSDDLEPEPAVESEQGITPEEVEANLNSAVILDEDELDDYSDEATDWDENMSKDLTCQQISDD